MIHKAGFPICLGEECQVLGRLMKQRSDHQSLECMGRMMALPIRGESIAGETPPLGGVKPCHRQTLGP
ncbi:hypothetical protein ABWL39_04955 [Chitinivorax sp. PXF-14]|uniref:hypothetical protein n=1 Tax=Chitinivorax sp. PXF-14 TaxID=3230488 RepID=UPI003466D6EE